MIAELSPTLISDNKIRSIYRGDMSFLTRPVSPLMNLARFQGVRDSITASLGEPWGGLVPKRALLPQTGPLRFVDETIPSPKPASPKIWEPLRIPRSPWSSLRIKWVSDTEEQEYFEREVRAILKISGAEFRANLASGKYRDQIDDPAHSDLMYLALLAVDARYNEASSNSGIRRTANPDRRLRCQERVCDNGRRGGQ